MSLSFTIKTKIHIMSKTQVVVTLFWEQKQEVDCSLFGLLSQNQRWTWWWHLNISFFYCHWIKHSSKFNIQEVQHIYNMLITVFSPFRFLYSRLHSGSWYFSPKAILRAVGHSGQVTITGSHKDKTRQPFSLTLGDHLVTR